MKLLHTIRRAKQKWNLLVTKQLRKVGIFKRLNISFSCSFTYFRPISDLFFFFSVFQGDQPES